MFHRHDLADVGVVRLKHLVEDASDVCDFVCGEGGSELCDGVACVVNEGVYAFFGLLIAC